ncbi:hypothetical protein E4T52_11401 [Aureobasidium sp. EXF-3400]|nr:hypothetical protein E4T51_10409 [Aureobasidium sp. EXF-12344]KAI4773630.1 hypothetical protein E4T52_11401 [Aureobasidium sp. EXF-3400]
MSADYQGQDPIKLATQAEQDLNSHAAKHGKGGSDSTSRASTTCENILTLPSVANESGVDESVSNKFPGADVTVGGTGASNNISIPESEGGDINPSTGKLYKAGEFEGAGGPETKAQIHRENDGGDDDVRSNVRN